MPPKQRLKRSNGYIWFPEQDLYRIMGEYEQMRLLLEEVEAVDVAELRSAFLRVNEELLTCQQENERLEEEIKTLRNQLKKRRIKQDQEWLVRQGKL